MHHKQNCDGQFDNAGEAIEGYAQTNPHLRQMEMDANRDGSMCLRDFEDKLKKENTIYYEHLQKEKIRCLQKIGKNKEVNPAAEAWGFKFNSLDEFNEFNGEGELQAEGEGDEEIEELAQARQAKDRRNLTRESLSVTKKKRRMKVMKRKKISKKATKKSLMKAKLLKRVKKKNLMKLLSDYIDIDGDGDKEESMKDAAKDKKGKGREERIC